MIEERRFHPLDYMSVVRRRMWWFIVPLAFCIVVGGALALLLPREYLSQATIGVAAPTLSPELLKGVSSLDKEERQRAISQQLLSPTVLQRVVREERINPDFPVDQVAQWLRANVEQNISVPNPITKSEPGKGLDSFILGYTDSDPERARRIANRIAYVFVEENSKSQIERTENTSEILSQQVQASQGRLAKLENDLRVKKEAYMGRLPDQVNANVQMVNGLRSQLESLSGQLHSEQDRLSSVEGQIDMMRQGGTGTTASSIAAIQTAQSHVNELQKELAVARTQYTEKHPEIARLQEELAGARKDLAAAQQQSGKDDALAADPAYKQKIQERDASRMRISELKRASKAAQAQIALYQSRVDAAPMVEQELESLKREVELEKAHYSDLTQRHQNALTAENLARKQGGERFSVLFPANLPGRPTKPDLLKVMALSIVAGLVLGAAAAIGREFLDRSVHDVRALQNEFEVPVLGEIPRIPA
jgi:polysaccharide chain length determinant protein (PEP-CTERM system associated)